MNGETKIERLRKRAREKAGKFRSSAREKRQQFQKAARKKAQSIDRDTIREKAASVADGMEVQEQRQRKLSTAERAEETAKIGSPINASLEPTTHPENMADFAAAGMGGADMESPATEEDRDDELGVGFGFEPGGMANVDEMVTGGFDDTEGEDVGFGFEFGFGEVDEDEEREDKGGLYL